MNGSAPNSPDTGSQISVRQKLKPNFAIESHDWRTSSKPIATTISTSTSPKRPVPILKPRSLRNMSEMDGSGIRAQANLHRFHSRELRELKLDDFSRQGRIAKTG